MTVWLESQAEIKTVLEQVQSCGSVSCLVNTEPLELLCLQPSELIASESVLSFTFTNSLFSFIMNKIRLGLDGILGFMNSFFRGVIHLM